MTKGLSKYLQGPYLQLNSETLSEINPERMFIMTNGASSNEPSYQELKKILFGTNLMQLKIIK